MDRDSGCRPCPRLHDRFDNWSQRFAPRIWIASEIDRVAWSTQINGRGTPELEPAAAVDVTADVAAGEAAISVAVAEDEGAAGVSEVEAGTGFKLII